ncbi:unnamed protein product, partial [Bubo scandiacus]
GSPVTVQCQPSCQPSPSPSQPALPLPICPPGSLHGPQCPHQLPHVPNVWQGLPRPPGVPMSCPGVTQCPPDPVCSLLGSSLPSATLMSPPSPFCPCPHPCSCPHIPVLIPSLFLSPFLRCPGPCPHPCPHPCPCPRSCRCATPCPSAPRPLTSSSKPLSRPRLRRVGCTALAPHPGPLSPHPGLAAPRPGPILPPSWWGWGSQAGSQRGGRDG